MAAASLIFSQGDTERLEKLFDLYTKMTTQQKPAQKPAQRKI